MSRFPIIRYFLGLVLLLAAVGGLAVNQAVVVAQDELELETKFPVLSGESGEVFEFEVDLKYQGAERRRFDLTTSVPPDWVAFAESGYPKKQIVAIELGPAETYATTEKITVRFGPVYWKLPEPGDYVVTLEISSGELKEAIELTAEVTAKYGLEMTTETGRLNTEVTAGRDNHFAIKLVNPGSVAIENITFSSTRPEGWSITYNPDKVDSLEAGLTQEVDVVINPPRRTIAGDWPVTIKAESKKISDDLELRVTVLTPTIWGWVGIIIVLVVIAGLAVLFRQLGRR